MKRLLLALCLVTFASPFLRAQSLTAEDRASGLAYLEKTHAAVIAATRDLSPAQLNFKPTPERWSVAEVTEHIAASEDFIFAMIATKS